MKEWHLVELNKYKRRLENAVVTIQRLWRGQRKGDRFFRVVEEARRRKTEIHRVG